MPQHSAVGIQSVGYDPTTRALLIVCGNANAYRYGGVPKDVYESLLSAASREQFVRESVQGRYPREKYPCLAVGEGV